MQRTHPAAAPSQSDDSDRLEVHRQDEIASGEPSAEHPGARAFSAGWPTPADLPVLLGCKLDCCSEWVGWRDISLTIHACKIIARAARLKTDAFSALPLEMVVEVQM